MYLVKLIIYYALRKYYINNIIFTYIYIYTTTSRKKFAYLYIYRNIDVAFPCLRSFSPQFDIIKGQRVRYYKIFDFCIDKSGHFILKC